ncbi:MAG: hypothetical protein RIQ96_2302, partial [Pseudomonadota bacterium]
GLRAAILTGGFRCAAARVAGGARKA